MTHAKILFADRSNPGRNSGAPPNISYCGKTNSTSGLSSKVRDGCQGYELYSGWAARRRRRDVDVGRDNLFIKAICWESEAVVGCAPISSRRFPVPI